MGIGPASRWLWVLAVSLAASSMATAAPAYTVTYLGSSDGIHQFVENAVGLNDIGQVVWGTTIWDATHGARQLAQPGSGTAEVIAINNQGLAVGCFDGAGESLSIAWPTAQGLDKWIALPRYGGDTGSQFWTAAVGVNEGGQVIGQTGGADIGTVACIWEHGAGGWTARALGTMPQDARSNGCGINDAGRAVGIYWADVVHHAYVWQDGTVAALPALPGQDNSSAYRINNLGQAVGTACGPGRHAVLWNTVPTASAPLDLGDGQACDISDTGQVVGCSPSTYSQAAIWPQGKAPPVNLNSLIDPSSGWVLDIATAINRHGQIVGTGEFHGSGSVFLLTPLAPPACRPDAMIRDTGLSGSSWVGDNIYDTTGASQKVTRTVRPTTRWVCWLKAQNDGTVQDRFYIHGTGSVSAWQVRYFDAALGGTDITDQVVADAPTYCTPALGRGMSRTLRVEITPLRNAAGNRVRAVIVSVISATDPTVQDTVRAVPTVGLVYRPDLLVRAKGSPDYIGNDTYGDGQGQIALQDAGLGASAIYCLAAQNDGNIPDTFTITGNGGGSGYGWTVRYYDALTGGKDITAAVTGAGWATTAVGRGGQREFRVEVSPGSNLPLGASRALRIRCKSAGDPARTDTVGATTTRR